MDFTIKLNILPCSHIVVTFTSGLKSRQIVMTRDEIREELSDFDQEEAIKTILFSFVKEQLALGKTLPEIKKAIESEVFRL